MNPRDQELISRIRAELEREPRVNLHRWPVSLTVDFGDLVIEGEVESVAAKKLALELAAATPGVNAIIDRLHVQPSQRRPDGEIQAKVIRALSEDNGLSQCDLVLRRDGRTELARAGALGRHGEIEVSVTDGVITLDGDVPSLTHKRLAESLAWWVPGTRDVVNGLGVTPPEEDSDEEIADAMNLVLEKDPLLRGENIAVRCDHRVVTLAGTVHTEAQRRAAEDDGWCLFGVDKVVSTLRVLR